MHDLNIYGSENRHIYIASLRCPPPSTMQNSVRRRKVVCRQTGSARKTWFTIAKDKGSSSQDAATVFFPGSHAARTRFLGLPHLTMARKQTGQPNDTSLAVFFQSWKHVYERGYIYAYTKLFIPINVSLPSPVCAVASQQPPPLRGSCISATKTPGLYRLLHEQSDDLALVFTRCRVLLAT